MPVKAGKRADETFGRVQEQGSFLIQVPLLWQKLIRGSITAAFLPLNMEVYGGGYGIGRLR